MTMTPDQQREQLDREIAAFALSRESLLAHHMGKFVVFQGEELRGAFDTFNTAARFALAEFGQGPYLIRQVGAPESMRMPASVAFRPLHAAG